MKHIDREESKRIAEERFNELKSKLSEELRQHMESFVPQRH